MISFVCLNQKVALGRPAWDLGAGEAVETGVCAPFFSIIEYRGVCGASRVAHVSVLDRHFKLEPCIRWRIVDV